MLDLTTREGIDRFTDLFGTSRGRWLANRLNLAGRGSERLAGAISGLAWNAKALKACKSEHAKNIYLHCCACCVEEIEKIEATSGIGSGWRRRFILPCSATIKTDMQDLL
jgi:hypothetical protein